MESFRQFIEEESPTAQPDTITPSAKPGTKPPSVSPESNLMATEGDRWLSKMGKALMDFQVREKGTISGTIEYMPPEIAAQGHTSNDSNDFQSLAWALKDSPMSKYALDLAGRFQRLIHGFTFFIQQWNKEKLSNVPEVDEAFWNSGRGDRLGKFTQADKISNAFRNPNKIKQKADLQQASQVMNRKLASQQPGIQQNVILTSVGRIMDKLQTLDTAWENGQEAIGELITATGSNLANSWQKLNSLKQSLFASARTNLNSIKRDLETGAAHQQYRGGKDKISNYQYNPDGSMRHD